MDSTTEKLLYDVIDDGLATQAESMIMEAIKLYLTDGIYPAGYNKEQRKLLRTSVEKGQFVLEGRQLYYNTHVGRESCQHLNKKLLVVTEKEVKMRLLWECRTSSIKAHVKKIAMTHYWRCMKEDVRRYSASAKMCRQSVKGYPMFEQCTNRINTGQLHQHMGNNEDLDEEEVMNLLTTLYKFQKKGQMCDATLVSTDGSLFLAHAGVLAAASPPLMQGLGSCQRGEYCLETSYSNQEILNLIHFSYTGQIITPFPIELMDNKMVINGNLDRYVYKQRVCLQLHQFAERGLFCDTAVNTLRLSNELLPAQSYVLAAKYSFLLPYTRAHSYVSITSPHVCSLKTKTSHQKQQEFVHPDQTSCGRTESKPYRCDVCHKRFTLLAHLKKHTKISHTGYKPYVCDVCNKGFAGRRSHAAHQLLHTGEKPHVCVICNKRFTQAAQLKHHQYIHTGERPYVCGVCNKGFTWLSGLKRHCSIHVGDTPLSM